jgi:hypothetical protein
MKRLILDRGFLDAEKIGHCKRDLGIDVLIPARRSMDIYRDVVQLAESGVLQSQPVPAAVPAAPPFRCIGRKPFANGRSAATHTGQAQRGG